MNLLYYVPYNNDENASFLADISASNAWNFLIIERATTHYSLNNAGHRSTQILPLKNIPANSFSFLVYLPGCRDHLSAVKWCVLSNVFDHLLHEPTASSFQAS